MERAIPFCQSCGDPRVLATGFSPHAEGFEGWTIYGCGHVTTQSPRPIEELIPETTDVTLSTDHSVRPAVEAAADTAPDPVTVSLDELTAVRLMTSLPWRV